MAEQSKAIVQVLQGVLQKLSTNPYPHVPNPQGCTKRASVAVIIRVRPPYTPLPTAHGSVIAVDKPDPSPSTIEDFFSQPWVQEGDPEVLFIKRAGRAGDRWSGHTALPGGKRDPEDADDLAAAIRETREEIGLDLDTSDCIAAGNLPERVVTTSWGKLSLMVLCPYIFLMTSKQIPALQPQPTEVAATHWVPLRALLSESLRTREFVDVSSRMARQGGPVLRHFLSIMLGKMMFSAISLVPSESVYASSIPGFIPDSNTKPQAVSGWAQAAYGVPESSKALTFQQPILLWGLTLGVLADLLDMLPPYNAVALWKYPNFTTPDLRFLVYLFTLPHRRRAERTNERGTFSSGSWQNQTAVDSTTEAIAPPTVSEAEPTKLAQQEANFHKNNVGIGGLGVGSDPKGAVGKMLSGYYERIDVAIGVFLVYRTITAAGLGYWIFRMWRQKQMGKL